MKRKIISLILSVLMLIGLIPISSVFAAGTTNIVISADKTTAYPDDVIKFTVSIGAVEHLMGAEFKVAIPTGMTFVAGSASVADGLKTTLSCASADWTENSMKFTMYHSLTHSKNILPSNKDLGISEKNDYEFDRAFLPKEFDDMIKVARSMNRYDVVIQAYLSRYFGLRFEEAATLRLYQLEDALRYKQLNVKNTKGGLVRDIPVDRPIQEKILNEIVAYLRESGKKSKDYLICDSHKHSVKKEKASLQNWRSNHSDKFVDPNRRDYVRPDCKQRIKRPSWHGLRHLYFQENRRRLIAEGGMTERQVENEMSERMGHHRNDIKKFYSEFLKDS